MSGEIPAVSLEVYDPTGSIEITEIHAPRLAGLNGKTICELSDFTWEDYRTFPLIREQLQRRFPDASINESQGYQNSSCWRTAARVKIPLTKTETKLESHCANAVHLPQKPVTL